MSAAVSNAPASAASAAAATVATADVEAPTVDPTRDQLRPGGHPITSGDAAAVELATDLDAGDAAAPAGGAQLHATPRALEGSSLPFLAGLAAIISTIFILGDLLNKRMLHPASIVVFLLSVSYCVAMLRRQWASTGGGTRGGRNNNFTKEAREELITYFVFGAGPEGLPTEAGAEAGAGAGAGKEGNRQKQQERGNGASGDELQVSRTSSRRWRRERQSSSSDGNDGTVGGTGVSGRGAARNGRIDAINADTSGSLSANTPVPSTGPCSPAPLGEEEVVDGDAATAGTAEDAAVAASPGHATAAVTDAATPAGPELPGATGEDAAKEQASAAAKAAAEDDPTRAHSDSGEWSTGQACIVCFGDYEPGDRLARLPCRHVYHAQCIDEWLDRAKLPSCPLCKTDLRHATPPDDRSRSISTAGGGGTSANAARVGGGSGGGGGGEGVEFTGDNAV